MRRMSLDRLCWRTTQPVEAARWLGEDGEDSPDQWDITLGYPPYEEDRDLTPDEWGLTLPIEWTQGTNWTLVHPDAGFVAAEQEWRGPLQRRMRPDSTLREMMQALHDIEAEGGARNPEEWSRKLWLFLRRPDADRRAYRGGVARMGETRLE